MFGSIFQELLWIIGCFRHRRGLWFIFKRSLACFSVFRHELPSCDHEYRVVETSKFIFDGFTEFKTSIIIDLHMWFACT